MSLQTDGSVGLAKETIYGTAVITTKYPEYTEQSFTQKNDYLQGEGLRAGKVIARQSRRQLGQVQCEGSLGVELATKGMGVLLEACLGTGISTVRAGTVYQQLFTPATTDPMPSYTIQTGIPPIGGGAIVPQTFVGNVVESWEITAEAAGLVELSIDWVGKEMKEPGAVVAYAAPSYTSSAGLYTFLHGSIVLGVNGTDTLVPPTGIALGTTTPAVASAVITKFSLKGENSPDDGGYVFGSAGRRGRRPVYGLRAYSGTMTAEFTAATLRDYYLNQTSLQLVLTFVSDQLVFTGTYATFQIVIPALVFEGDVPSTDGGDIVTTDIDFTVLDGEVSASPLYMVLVTGDSAL